MKSQYEQEVMSWWVIFMQRGYSPSLARQLVESRVGIPDSESPTSRGSADMPKPISPNVTNDSERGNQPGRGE